MEFKQTAMNRKSSYYCHPHYDPPEEGKMKIRGTGQAFIMDSHNRETMGHHCIYVVELQGDPAVEVPCFIYPGGIETNRKKGR